MKKRAQRLSTFLRQKKQIYLFDFIIAYVGITSIIALSLLWAHVFSSLLTLILSAIIMIGLIMFFRFHVIFRDTRFGLWLLPIILIAALFRYNPSLYLAGGQDQGLYVSMSKTYEEYGQTIFPDETKTQLQKYSSQDNKGLVRKHAGVTNLSNDTQIMPFYPLHPLWMALFGELLGSDNRVYSLPFFGILSLLGFYLLLYELSGKNKYIGYTGTLLLAVNPLHVFFSKFPTTEIPAFAFIILTFAYLARFYIRAINNKYDFIPFLLSLLCVNAFMYTRMSIFMYLPFIYGVIVLAIVLIKNSKLEKVIASHVIIFGLLYILSLIFYYYNSNNLFNTIYQTYIVERLGDQWMLKLIIILTFACLFLLIVYKQKHLKEYIQQKVHLIQKLPIIISVGLIVLSLYHFYEFGFVESFSGHPRFDQYKLPGREWLSIQNIYSYAIFLYASPFGFVLFLVAIASYNFRSTFRFSLIIFIFFILLFWGYIQLSSKYITYHFYYARYLLTEIIPFIIATYTLYSSELYIKGSRAVKYLLISLFIVITLYFSFFSGIQLFRNEGPQQRYYEDLYSYISPDDLIISQVDAFYNEIFTPLRYYYGQDVILYNRLAINNYGINKLDSLYDNIYLLTNNKKECGSLPTRKIDYVFTYFTNGLPHVYRGFKDKEETPLLPYGQFLIPSSYVTNSYTTYLCRFDNEVLDLSYFTGADLRSYASGLYSDGWTNGNLNITHLNIKLLSEEDIFIIETYDRSPILNTTEQPELSVKINNTDLQYMYMDNDDVYFAIPESINAVQTIEIRSDTFIPKKRGITNDSRELGIDIKAIDFE